jgi:acyl-CoA synthetase (AMP-forming)/AMP-acid ligase II
MLVDGARATAAWLHDSGLRAGDTAAIALDRSPHRSVPSLGLLYGCAYLGVCVLPLFPDVPFENRRQLIERFKARWLIAPGLGRTVAGASPVDPDAFDWQSARWRNANPPRGDEPGRPFMYAFTSGTTGDVKTCLFEHGQFVAHRRPQGSYSNSSTSDRRIPALPWPNKVGLRDLLRTHIQGGALVNIELPDSRVELAGVISRLGVTHITMSPWQMRRLLSSPAPAGFRMPSLRAVSVMGASASPSEIQACRALVTRNVFFGYGTNETGMIAVLGPDDPIDKGEGCVGRVLQEVEVEVVGSEGQTMPANVQGELRFRTPTMATGYVDNETATKERFRDGWFYPGDQGLVDGDGFLILRGRVDDMINFGGLKIAPGDVESALALHPALADVAVVGVPHVMSGEMPVAFVVVRDEVSDQQLERFCAERVDSIRIPPVFVRVASIPRNSSGKIDRKLLRQKYASQTTSTSRDSKAGN